MSLVDDNPVSPFDVDLGGHQRAELRTGLRSASLELRAAREERLLIESRLSALCNRHALACAQQHERRTLQPVFSAWRRLCVVARAQMDHARTISSLEQEVHAKATVAAEKAEQVVALGERVVRVKTNAQSKLSELSEANKKLAAALEQRDAELRAYKRRASEGNRGLATQVAEAREIAAGARGELEATQQRLASAEETVRTLRSSRDAELLANEETMRELRVELSVALRALSGADGEIGAAGGQIGEYRLQADRHQARLDGALAESACLRAEAAAQRTLGPGGVGGGLGLWLGDGCARVGAEDSSVFAGEQGRLRSNHGLAMSPEAVELHRCRRTLISAVFWRWADSVALGKELAESSSSAAQLNALESKHAEMQAASDMRAAAESIHSRLLGVAVAEAEAAVASVAEEVRDLSSVVVAARAETDCEMARAESAAAAHVTQSAMLRGMLSATEEERARTARIAARLEAEMERGELVLMQIARSHRKSRKSES